MSKINISVARNRDFVNYAIGSDMHAKCVLSLGIGCSIFFARPYALWQRGLNEYSNSLVRQYFPKKSEFAAITQKDVDHVAEKLNNRPGKVLGYNTPLEVYQFLNKTHHVAPCS